jgi:hypothetical protein
MKKLVPPQGALIPFVLEETEMCGTNLHNTWRHAAQATNRGKKRKKKKEKIINKDEVQQKEIQSVVVSTYVQRIKRLRC